MQIPRVLFVVCVLIWFYVAVPAWTLEVPAPPAGQRAAATLALLEYQRSICDSIAGEVLTFWHGNGSASPDSDRVRSYVLEKQLSNLAASRSAADIIESFLPEVARETTEETASSLQRLSAHITRLCDVVALPTAPREDFERRIAEILDRAEREELELGRLLVVPEDAKSSALDNYLTFIQLAGMEAEGEYREYLESIRPKPQGPTIQQVMDQWHRDSYLPAVTPTKRALSTYLQARQQQKPRDIGKACRAMSTAVSTLLRQDSGALKAPDHRLEEPLNLAYIELRRLALNCTAGRSRELQKHFGRMQRHLGTAAEILAYYELRP